MATKIKRKDPMVALIIVLVLFMALAVGAWVWSSNISTRKDDALTKLQEEVDAENKKRTEEYAAAVEEHNNSIKADEPNPAWPSAAAQGWDVIDLTYYPLEQPGVTMITREQAMFGGLLLVNEWHSRPDDFDESGIQPLYTYAKDSPVGKSFWESSSCKLHVNATDALIEALVDAKAQGYTSFVVEAANSYRSYEDQKARFDKELEKYRSRHPDESNEQLVARAKKNVNYPGTSEFNSGLTFGLFLYDGSDYYRNTNFYDTPDGQWLLENSWKYGLVFRFPVDGYPMADTVGKKDSTGMSLKLNCYRYVGKAHAAVMNHLGLCLEEYIEYLMDHPHIAVFENGKLRYEITRQQVGDDVASFSVEVNRASRNYTMSLDNMGGLVTAYEY